MTYPRIVTATDPSTTEEYLAVNHAAITGRAQVRPTSQPWRWLVAWPTRRLYVIDAKAALISPYFPEAIGWHEGMTISQLAQLICIQHVSHIISSHRHLADPNHLTRRDR